MSDATHEHPGHPGFTFGPSALVTPANAVTVARLLAAPVYVVMLVVWGASWLNVVVGIVLAGSDGLDGYMARRHGTTRSGAFLDPLADKVIVLGALYALIIARPHGLTSFIIPAVLITLREIWMSVFRSRAAKRGISIPASRLAKWKTFTQDWAIAFCVLPITAHHAWLGEATIWIAVAMTLYTGWKYYADGKRATLRAS
jgi:CDP-diacylglycerol---glycerol-3-phosphate 3-phosphatidyltransferase